MCHETNWSERVWSWCIGLIGVALLMGCSSDDKAEASHDAPATSGPSQDGAAVLDPRSHDPTKLVAFDGHLMTWDSALGQGRCPLGFLMLKPDSQWAEANPMLDGFWKDCSPASPSWPRWLTDEAEGGPDFDAPGVLFSAAEDIPDGDGNKTQLVALYYSRYFDGTDESGQACIGRMTARRGGEGVFPRNLIWQDDDRPVLCSNTEAFEEDGGERFANPGEGTKYSSEGDWAENTTEALGLDAELFTTPDGKLFMFYGSHGPGFIKVVELDPNTGRLPAAAQPGWTEATDETLYPTVAMAPPYVVSLDGEIEQQDEFKGEAAYVHYHGGFYYLFLNWGACCNGKESTYEIVVGRSASPSGPYVDKNGQSMAKLYPEDNAFNKPANTPGGERFLNAEMLGASTHRGPGHPAIFEYQKEGATRFVFSFHYYEATTPAGVADGRLGMRALKWVEGWPVLEDPKEPWDPTDYFETLQ